MKAHSKLKIPELIQPENLGKYRPESIGTIIATIKKDGTLPGTARLRLLEGSAVAVKGRLGDFYDLTEAAGTLHFESTPSIKEIPIKIAIVDDSLEETNETFFVKLETEDPNARIVGPSTVTVTLEDNDAGAFSRNGTNHIRSGWTYPGRGNLSIQISGPNGTNASPEARWRFPWDTIWRTSNEPVLALPAGKYPIDWRAVVGQRPPELTSVDVMAGIPTDQAVVYRVGLTNLGLLRLGLDPTSGTAWRIAGITNMPALRHNESWPVSLGSHLIEVRRTY